MDNTVIDKELWRGTDQGARLKNMDGWNNNGNGINSSGFSGFPGSKLWDSGLGDYGYWWSSTGRDNSHIMVAWCRGLYYDSETVYRYEMDASYAISVRCIKDQP